MNKLNSVTLKLQENNISLLEVRNLFGGVIEVFPETEPYLVYNAQVVKDPAYERAPCKL